MRYDLKEILDLAERGGFAVPAFNVYNLEMLMGVMRAAEETKAPIIIQMYSRLFDTETGKRLAPSIVAAMNELKTPIAFHLDHGAGEKEVLGALRLGATGVMIDASTKPFEENVSLTANVVRIAHSVGVGVEGEIGHVGSASDEKSGVYTETADAVEFVERSGVDALAIMVGTAHGKYKQAPRLFIERIKEIHKKTNAHLVLHGGSGVSDDQIKLAIDAGIRKINYATDLCCALVDGMNAVGLLKEPLDVGMSKAADYVKDYAIDRIKVLGADRYEG